MFARNHNDSRLFRTRLCVSIWISTRVSARFGLMPPFQGLLFCVEESLKAVCAFRECCAIDLLGRKQNLTDGSECNPTYLPSQKNFVGRWISGGRLLCTGQLSA